jgi:hypothetical protein
MTKWLDTDQTISLTYRGRQGILQLERDKYKSLSKVEAAPRRDNNDTPKGNYKNLSIFY